MGNQESYHNRHPEAHLGRAGRPMAVRKPKRVPSVGRETSRHYCLKCGQKWVKCECDD